MTIRHFYCFFNQDNPVPRAPVWKTLMDSVASRFRFQSAKVTVTPLKICYDVRIETLAEGAPLEEIIEYVAGYLDALKAASEATKPFLYT